jgi:hypothetical protein
MSGGANIAEAEQGVTSNRELLPLDLPERVVALKIIETGKIVRHIFNPITRADADAYFGATKVVTERIGKDSMDMEIDVVSARLKLYGRAIKRVDGYLLTGGRDLMDLPNWKEKLNAKFGGHQVTAIAALTNVTPSVKGPDDGIDPDAEIVSLDAFWTSTSDVGNSRYLGLLHRFSPPTLEHWKRLNSQASRSTVQGGSRSHKTIYPKMNTISIELYDELILSVGGYSIGGEAVSAREQLLARMDCFHKIAAIEILFDASGSDIEVEGIGEE